MLAGCSLDQPRGRSVADGNASGAERGAAGGLRPRRGEPGRAPGHVRARVLLREDLLFHVQQ